MGRWPERLQKLGGTTYCTQWSHEDVVAAKKRQKRLRTRQKLPWHDGNSKDGADNLASFDGHVAGEQSVEIGSEGNTVCAKVCAQNSEQVGKGHEEDTSSSTWSPVMVEDGIQKVPQVPYR